MEEGNKYSYYLQDLGAELREIAEEALRDARLASKYERQQLQAELMAYSRVLSVMQQQADAFDIPYGELSLEGLDPDNDLLVESDRPTPEKRRHRGYYTWSLRLGRRRFLFTLLAYRMNREFEPPYE